MEEKKMSVYQAIEMLRAEVYCIDSELECDHLCCFCEYKSKQGTRSEHLEALRIAISALLEKRGACQGANGALRARSETP